MYECKILADSWSTSGHRLTTFEVTFPRFILAEFNTHRMLSRNAASSRAIPINKRIEAIEKDPYIPEEWGSKKAGMQAGPPIEDVAPLRRRWLYARDQAIDNARWLDESGVHKQLVNRLLEPFAWVTVVASATTWDNFFHLRTHPDAQPEFQIIAKMMQSAMRVSRPPTLQSYDWHLPYITPEEVEAEDRDYIVLARMSSARCARVSYLTHDGKRDRDKDLELANRLFTSGHMSPFEHPAMAQDKPYAAGNFLGWTPYRKFLVNEDDPLRDKPQ